MKVHTNTHIFNSLLAAAAVVLTAGCNGIAGPDVNGTGITVKPVFDTEIPASQTTRSSGGGEGGFLSPFTLADGTQIEMSVTKEEQWPIAGPQGDAVLTKGTVYYGTGTATYTAKSFRLSAWNASQSNSALFTDKVYTCSAGDWTTAAPTGWPGTSDNLEFVGVWDSSDSATASLVSNRYGVSGWDVSGNYDDQKDLRVAFATYPANHNNDVLLYFNPYMNAIRFKVGTLPEGFKVTKVELQNVGVIGTLVFANDYTPVLPVSGRQSYVGDWQNITTGNLSLSGNWTSGASVTPDGTAFLIIDPDGGTLAGTMAVTFKNTANDSTVLTKSLSVLGSDIKCGEALTVNIGQTFNYTFNMYNAVDSTITITDTTATSVTIPINSIVTINGGITNPVDWEIKEVTRNRVTTPVGGTSFDSSVGHGFSATKIENSLRVTSDKRIIVNRGNKAYWTNPANEDWAPTDWSSNGVIDLSKTDFASDDPSKINTENMTTANCYIIRHAGTYRIPLVYGNAIKDGSTNTPSYQPTPAPYFCLKQFKNSNNANISSPFIENNKGQTANKVIILWQDEADVIELVNQPLGTEKKDYNKDDVRYIQFTVPQNKICQNNALIAVTNSNGEVIWSWHIWITNDPGLLKPAIPVKNLAGYIYNFFPLPCLGCIEEEGYPARYSIQIVLEQKRNGDVPKNTITLTVQQPDINTGSPNGCYYQFGRKDPMCRVDSPAIGTFNKGGVGRVSLADAIKHPEVFYNHGSYSSYDWCSDSGFYYNLWSGGYCETGFIEQNVVSKTVYDPSPRGYMMPASNAFSGFTSDGHYQSSIYGDCRVDGPWNKGWNFRTGDGENTIFFPAAGERAGSSGERNNVGDYGNYWSAVPVDTDNGHSLYFYSGFVSPANGSNRSDGLSVRPVRE